jgi:hypothetical protein
MNLEKEAPLYEEHSMKRILLTALAGLISLQSVAFASSRVALIADATAESRAAEKAELQDQLNAAQAGLKELKQSLNEANENSGRYYLALSYRNGSAIAAGVSALGLIGLAATRQPVTKPAQYMIHLAVSALVGISLVVNVGTALVAEGYVVLTEYQVTELREKIASVELAITDLQTQLAQ